MAVEKILLQFEADIKDLKSELGEVKSQLGNVEKQTEQTGSKMTNTFKNVGKAIAGAFAIREVVRFGQEAIRLAATLEGVEAAFKRIATPGLLDELRKATKGTVSDLELMQSAVRASNFRIPLEQLAKYFQFAQQRARETGESVDYLVNSIIDGIGKGSTMVLDNLGLSASEIREEFKKTGDLALAVGNIIERGMGESGAGGTIETTADKMDRMSATFKNLQTDLGQRLLPIMEILIGALEDVGQSAVFVQDKIFEVFNFLGSQKAKQALESKEAQALVDTYLEMGLSVQELTFKQSQLQDSLAQIPKLMQENRQANGNNQESYKALVEAQDEMETELLAVNTVLQILNKTMTGSRDGSGNGGTSGALDKTKINLKLLREEGDKVPKKLYTNYLAWLQQETAITRVRKAILELEKTTKTSNVTKFYDLLDVKIDDLDQANIDFFENLEEKRREDQDSQDQWFDNLENGLRAAQTLFGSYGQLLIEIGGKQSALAEFGRQLAFFEIATAQAVATANAVKLVSTSAKTPIDYFVFLASILSSIAVNIGKSRALIEQDSVPQFATGVVDLKGAGTETSDSIHAKLSRGESVITAKGTRQDKGLFEAANKLQLEKYINENYVLPALIKVNKERSSMFDDYRLYRELRNSQGNENKNFDRLIRTINRKKTRYDWN